MRAIFVILVYKERANCRHATSHFFGHGHNILNIMPSLHSNIYESRGDKKEVERKRLVLVATPFWLLSVEIKENFII